MRGLPDSFRSDVIAGNGVELHVVHNGPPLGEWPVTDGRKPLLCLHGFPEFWVTWEQLMPLIGDDYFLVAPDQRGCGSSSMPHGDEQYDASFMVADMVALTQMAFGDRAFDLMGHDFGASIAYALVFAVPERVRRLVIVNGVHPVCLQEALIDDANQAAASAYFHELRADGAAERFAADGFEPLFANLEQHSSSGWLSEAMRVRLREGWGNAERLDAMFAWYRTSPIVVPIAGKPVPEAPLYGVPSSVLRVPMPHLLIWGVDDSSLLASTRARLPEFCDDLTVEEVAGADHWILHTRPDVVAKHLDAFLA